MKFTLSIITALGIFAGTASALTPQDVEKQIQQIQSLPLNERVQKMNELKEEIRKLNESQREEIMNSLMQKHDIVDQGEKTITQKAGDMKTQMDDKKAQIEHEMSEHMKIETPDIEAPDIQTPDIQTPEIPDVDMNLPSAGTDTQPDTDK